MSNRDSYVPRITKRQIEVASLVAKGLKNREIASILHASHRTIESHVSTMLSELHLQTRVELALYYLKHQTKLEKTYKDNEPSESNGLTQQQTAIISALTKSLFHMEKQGLSTKQIASFFKISIPKALFELHKLSERRLVFRDYVTPTCAGWYPTVVGLAILKAL